jgi:hypothetical protein
LYNIYLTIEYCIIESGGEKIITNQVQNDGLSFLPRIRVRDKLQQETKLFNVPGFRIKCGMTAQELHSIIYSLTIRVNLRNPRLKRERMICANYAKQSQSVKRNAGQVSHVKIEISSTYQLIMELSYCLMKVKNKPKRTQNEANPEVNSG